MSEPALLDQWKERQDSLIEEIERTRKYYKSRGRSARYAHRALSIIVLVGSILAPVTVAPGAATAAGTNLTVLGISQPTLASFSLITTIVVALAEGLRRMFRFDESWSNCWLTGEAIRQATERYRDATVGAPAGTAEWKTALQNLRREYDEAVAKESVNYFDVVRSVSAKGNQRQ